MGSAMGLTNLLLGILVLYGVLNLSGCVSGSSVVDSNKEDDLSKDNSVNDRRGPFIVVNGEDNNSKDPLPTKTVYSNGFTIRVPVLNEEPEYNDTTKDEEDSEGYIAPPDFIETNPTVLPDGTILTEGDMVLTNEQAERIYSQTQDRKAITPDFYNRPGFVWNARWPADSSGNVIIKYRITRSSFRNTTVIKRALQHWEQHTCLSFQQVFTDGAFSHIFFAKRSGCYSQLGRDPDRNGRPAGQAISIGNGCASLGVIAHEVGHAIGFVHEQSRTDRDDYVKIFLQNVYSRNRKNFRKGLKSHNHALPYDYTSLMHYGDRRIFLSPTSPTAVIRSEDARGGENCEWFVQAPPGRRIWMLFRRWLLHRTCYMNKRRYWWGICQRYQISCNQGRGGLLISRTGNVHYRFVRPLCSSRFPLVIKSTRNQLSISYQRTIRYKGMNWRDWYLKKGSEEKLRPGGNPRKRAVIRRSDKSMSGGSYCGWGRYCRRWSFVQSFPLVLETVLMLV